MCPGKLKATHWAPWPRGSGNYPVNEPNERLLAYLFLSLQATSNKLYIFIACFIESGY